ncbi:PLP-dependent transferase [Bacteroidales bacterium AH-315-N07]|nr:PLP-dependent transferase [Bacteroidales bacterium AH-315-N07]
MEFDSLCIHGADNLGEAINSHLPPIYASSTFTFDSTEQCLNAIKRENNSYVYTRWDNPTNKATADKIAALEGYGISADNDNPIKLSALLFSSGLAAISTLLSSTLIKDDKILTHGSIYGGTAELMDKVLPNMGINRVTIDMKDLNLVEDTLKQHDDIKIIYVETPANPTLDCYDLETLTQLSEKYNLKSVVDNTFSTPYLQQPFKYGADFVLHSTTKYLNGHGTAIGGVVIGKDIDFMTNKLWETFKLQGGCCSPFDAWLVNLGINTLPIRMDKHCQNAMEIAQYLDQNEKISRVNYLGLPDHPEHILAKKQMRDFGGMLSFELKDGFAAAVKLLDHVQFCKHAGSLGTVDTLIIHPASTTHAGVAKEIRESFGITDSLIRVSVGIENSIDIINDLEQALQN